MLKFQNLDRYLSLSMAKFGQKLDLGNGRYPKDGSTIQVLTDTFWKLFSVSFYYQSFFFYSKKYYQ